MFTVMFVLTKEMNSVLGDVRSTMIVKCSRKPLGKNRTTLHSGHAFSYDKVLMNTFDTDYFMKYLNKVP